MREDLPGRVLMTLKLATFLPNAIVDSLHATAIPHVFGLVNENASIIEWILRNIENFYFYVCDTSATDTWTICSVLGEKFLQIPPAIDEILDFPRRTKKAGE